MQNTKGGGNMKVIDKHTGKELNRAEILEEVNRDRSDEWQDYTPEDLEQTPGEVLEWIDPQYFLIEEEA